MALDGVALVWMGLLTHCWRLSWCPMGSCGPLVAVVFGMRDRNVGVSSVTRSQIEIRLVFGRNLWYWSVECQFMVFNSFSAKWIFPDLARKWLTHFGLHLV